MYEVTRQQIVDAALALQGARFRHQGRDPETGVDCVGLLVCVGRAINYPHILDVEGYRRVPSANTIRTTLNMNCDEIPLEEVRRGDIYLMRVGGVKPRHVAIRISDETDYEKGIEPMLIHAFGMGPGGTVTVESVRQRLPDCVVGFRIRGLID